MSDDIEAVLKKAEEMRAEGLATIEKAERLVALKKIYPDLRVYVGRWNKEVYCSKLVNPIVTDYEALYSCGCCSDAPLKFWAYLETPHGRVYADPCNICIGEKGWTGYARASEGWRQALERHQIPQVLIDRVALFFKQEKADALEAAEREHSEMGEGPEPLV